ncbi:ParB/RepB/Spo0J family partition protein [Sulfitobacter sediminilitoris]
MFSEAAVGAGPVQVRNRLAPGAAPIADMAGAAAAQAALEEVSAELASARGEGRLIQKLPLSRIDPAHLMRDRVLMDEDDLQTLMTSIRARGQQTPIEVIETSPGRYGLISGSRRLAALKRLHAETGEERFDRVQALVRRPPSAQDAYVAMVEENEVRVGLSYYERAQIVARTVEAGVYPSSKKALQVLFAAASRAKRSKIKSFLPIVEELGAVLQHPAAIGERLGLDLAQRLEDTALAEALREALGEDAPRTAEDEQAILAGALEGKPEAAAEPKTNPAKSQTVPGEEFAPGLHMTRNGSKLTLSGPGVTDALVDRLRAVLSGG